MSENLPEETQEGAEPAELTAPSQVNTQRASLSANQVVLSTSPLPSISEMEWMQENCPEFLAAFQQDLLDESQRRRGMELRGQNTGRYLGTLAFGVMAYSVQAGSPWAAATLMGGAALFYAAAMFFLSHRRSSDLPNITAENRGVRAEREIEERQG